MKSKASKRKFRIVGINFDHMHMGDLLRMAHEHPEVEIAAICDEERSRMRAAAAMLGLKGDQVFTDIDRCMATEPDLVILCPATGLHADYVERLAPHGVHLLVEKPFAANLAEADRMIAAAKKHRIRLAINWPLRWVASHCTAWELLREGRIGELEEVHYYDGNRGPLYHTAGKLETKPTPAMKRKSWFYKTDKGGGSLLDYLGYGTTLGTWFHDGARPEEVTTLTFTAPGLEVDEHSITIARYARGLSKFETRWGTFTDPWRHQPQPKCGFVLKGTSGTISSYDYEPVITIQTERHPQPRQVAAKTLKPPFQNPIQYMVHCLRNVLPIEGPLSPGTSRIGQEIVDAAVRSAHERRAVRLN